MTSEPRWIDKRSLLLLHDESIAEHGGLSGLRDEGLLDSALARPQNQLAYGGEADLASLAAAYCVGIARNHPFADGNKRAAFLSLGLFLALNGHRLNADRLDAINTMLGVAAGDIDDQQLTEWVKRNMRAR